MHLYRVVLLLISSSEPRTKLSSSCFSFETQITETLSYVFYTYSFFSFTAIHSQSILLSFLFNPPISLLICLPPSLCTRFIFFLPPSLSTFLHLSHSLLTFLDLFFYIFLTLYISLILAYSSYCNISFILSFSRLISIPLRHLPNISFFLHIFPCISIKFTVFFSSSVNSLFLYSPLLSHFLFISISLTLFLLPTIFLIFLFSSIPVLLLPLFVSSHKSVSPYFFFFYHLSFVFVFHYFVLNVKNSMNHTTLLHYSLFIMVSLPNFLSHHPSHLFALSSLMINIALFCSLLSSLPPDNPCSPFPRLKNKTKQEINSNSWD